MSREIKFRCWDNVRNEYLSSGKVMIQVLPGRTPKAADGLYLDTSNFMCADGRMTLEQFTGLIHCDGEVAKAGDHVGDWDQICVGDRFLVDGIGVCHIVICPFYGVCFDDGGNCGPVPVIDCIAENDRMELIGNIHENKDEV